MWLNKIIIALIVDKEWVYQRNNKDNLNNSRLSRKHVDQNQTIYREIELNN